MASDSEEHFSLDPHFFIKEEHPCCFYEDAFSKKHLILTEDSDHTLYMGWTFDALFFKFDINATSFTACYPEIEKGDSLELFIDTRDLKRVKSVHRFCHHFFFLPEAHSGITHGEKTVFRSDDRHPLAAAEDIEFEVTRKKNGYSMTIILTKEALTGYEPAEIKKIGFTYRLNKTDDEPYTFSIPHTVEHCLQVPYLWPTITLQESL